MFSAPVWGVNGSLHKLPLKMMCTECLKANHLLYSCVLPAARWLHCSGRCQAAVSVVKQSAYYKNFLFAKYLKEMEFSMHLCATSSFWLHYLGDILHDL